MRIKLENDYKCCMITPSVNLWYDDDKKNLFIGWLFWGFAIYLK